MSLEEKCCRVQKFLPVRGRGQIDRKRENLPSCFARASDIVDKPAFKPALRFLYAGQNPPKRHCRQIRERALPRLTLPVPTDCAAWTAEMSCSLERCTNALDDLRLHLRHEHGARDAFVTAVALCDGLVEQFEFVRAPVPADLLNLRLAEKKAAAGWQLMRANSR